MRGPRPCVGKRGNPYVDAVIASERSERGNLCLVPPQCPGLLRSFQSLAMTNKGYRHCEEEQSDDAAIYPLRNHNALDCFVAWLRLASRNDEKRESLAITGIYSTNYPFSSLFILLNLSPPSSRTNLILGTGLIRSLLSSNF